MKAFRRLFLGLVIALNLAVSTPANAHPELVLYIDTSASVYSEGQRLFVDYYIAKSKQYSFAEIVKFEGNLAAYSMSECTAASEKLRISTGDFELPLQLRSSVALEDISQTGAGAWIWCQFATPVRFYDVVEFSWADQNFPGIPGHREFNLGIGNSPSRDLTNYDEIPSLLTQLEAEFNFEFPVAKEVTEEVKEDEVSVAVDSEEVIAPPLSVSPVREEFIEANTKNSTSWITRLSDRYFRSIDPSPAIVIIGSFLAFVLGALHSIAPGHGKSIMAVLALAERGRRKEIYRLGITMGITHTLGVFILGSFFILGSNFVPPDIIPILGIISGTLIIAIGAFYLARFVKHAYEHRLGHEHHHHHDEAVSGRRIALLGVVGGMVPTPTALTVLVGTAALGSAWYGVLLVALYGVGMTLVLIFAGRLIENLYRFAESVVDSRGGVRIMVQRAPAVAASAQVLAGVFLVAISYGALI